MGQYLHKFTKILKRINHNHKTMNKPKRLKKGDLIAVISPSWGGPSVFPHIFEIGLKRLRENFGLRIKEFPMTRACEKEVYENPKKRAKDINDAFNDKNVKGIITSIGGNDGIRVLEYLDSKAIKKNPKFFMGYSDTTVFNVYLNRLGLVAFNGPAIMAGFAEAKELKEDFVTETNKFLFENYKEYEYKPFKEYTNKYLDWSKPETLKKENNNYVKYDGWKFIQGDKKVEGILFGGCIEVLEFLNGTKYWPKPNFWKGKILFFETSEDKPSPIRVGLMLRNYGIQGILKQVNGIFFGRARDYTTQEKIELENEIKKILKEFNREDLLVVTNLDFGHTDPQWILPLGVRIQINPKNKMINLLEAPFS